MPTSASRGTAERSPWPSRRGRKQGSGIYVTWPFTRLARWHEGYGQLLASARRSPARPRDVGIKGPFSDAPDAVNQIQPRQPSATANRTSVLRASGLGRGSGRHLALALLAACVAMLVAVPSAAAVGTG